MMITAWMIFTGSRLSSEFSALQVPRESDLGPLDRAIALNPDTKTRSGLLLFLAGRLPVHFSTVFPLERRDMVIDGAAERRLQAIHRDRCTWWRAMVPPWCIHSLVRSLVCRVDRRPAAASDLHRWLGGRCELPHEDDWVSSAGSRAQQTTC